MKGDTLTKKSKFVRPMRFEQDFFEFSEIIAITL